MSKKVVVHVKIYALNLTNELIKGKGVASESGQPVANRENYSVSFINKMKDIYLHNIHDAP
jgi:hypothetical protein